MVFGNRVTVFLCAALMVEGLIGLAQEATTVDVQKDVINVKDSSSKITGKIKLGPKKNGRELKGNGNVVSDSREIQSASYINISGAFDVEIVPGGVAKTEIQVSADANLLDNLKTVIDGDQLMIYADKPYSSNNKITVSVKIPAFRGLYCEGASNVRVRSIDADILSLQVFGASIITLEGKALLLRGGIEGAGDLNALKMHTEKVDLTMSGASKAKINVSELLRVTASGAAEVFYTGRPVKIKKDLEGAAELKQYKGDVE